MTCCFYSQPETIQQIFVDYTCQRLVEGGSYETFRPFLLTGAAMI